MKVLQLQKSLEAISFIRNELGHIERSRKIPASVEDQDFPLSQIKSEEDARIVSMLTELDPLWTSLSKSLMELAILNDSQHTVLSLQNAAEAFFLAHSLCFTPNDLKENATAVVQQIISPASPPGPSGESAALIFKEEIKYLFFSNFFFN